MEQGKIKFTSKGSCYIQLKGGRKLPIPREFQVSPDHKNKLCEFERDKGALVKLKVGNTTIEIDATIVEQKQKAKEEKEKLRKEELERKKAEAKKSKQTNNGGNRNFGRERTAKAATVFNYFNINKSFAPRDTRESNFPTGKADNYHLKFNRFAQYDFKKVRGTEKYDFFFFRAKDRREKTFEFNEPNFKDATFEKLPFQQKTHIQNLVTPHGKMSSFTAKIDWRLLIGTGEASVYETGLTLHHLHGFPYIPASAVKGTTRSYIIKSYFENKEDKALKDPVFIGMFGNQDQMGKVHFVDAYPTKKPNLEADILNPHYPNYYDPSNKKTPPTDFQQPIPVNLLSVKEPSIQFNLYAFKNDLPVGESVIEKNSLGGLVELTQYYLKKALEDQGIGAKTSAGYGYFDIPE